MFRKRYTVVIVGETGSSAAQRSEVSRHRSERDAQIAAQDERDRLGGMHGDATGQYRVIVEREGVVVSTGPIADLTAMPASITHLVPDADDDLGTWATDPGRSHAIIPGPLEAVPTPDRDLPADTGAAEIEDPLGAATEPEDDIPSGPVPEEVLRRFEESIAREQERQATPENAPD
jgi:hypothetical protein